jgi:putative ABC transport system permease protein
MYWDMSLLQDVRFAVRLILKERWFTAVAVAALALGIGLNATVFSLVNAVLLRGLPFKDSAQLYMVGPRRATQDRADSLSMSELQDWRTQSKTFMGLAGFTRTGANLADEGALPEQARGALLTANAFQVLGQPPLIGRDFKAEDEQPGAERVVIIGHSLWKNRYGSNPSVLGRALRINGDPATIIGVMPDGMLFPMDATFWQPFVPTTAQLQNRGNRPLAIFGRLRDDATRAQAQAELQAIAGRLAAQYPETNKEHTSAIVQTFSERFNGGEIRQIFLALFGAVGFVLLISCANVANLLLSRAANRSREVAVRVALGASRWRVIRQLLVESVMLGFIGGAFGLLLAIVGVRMFDAAIPADAGKPYWIVFTVDWTVVGYLAVICVLTGILFGLAPALQVSRTSVNEVLKEGGRGSSGSRRTRWLSSTMVVAEIALTLVLLVGAGLMIRSFLAVYSMNLGIQTDYLMTMRLQLPNTKYPKEENRREFYDRLRPRLSSIAGAESVALSSSMPPQGAGGARLEIEGRPPIVVEGNRPAVSTVAISPGFFQTVGAPMRRGRDFDDRDGNGGSENVIVNQRFVSEYFPNEDPIGRRIRFPPGDPKAKPDMWRTIVGISTNILHGGRGSVDPTATVYTPARQSAFGGMVVLVKSRVEPGVMMSTIRREVQALDQDQPVFSMQTVDQLLAQQRWPYRVFGTLFGILAFIALVLSAVGLYAVMAYSVTQRTQEIGVRMALGAGASQVSWLILRRGLVQTSIGLAIGLAGAYYTSMLVRPLLVSVTPTDTSTFVGISLILIAVATAACLIPARRATRLDPLRALRVE